MGLTDWLDGYIARKFNSISFVGSILDPIGDKLLMGGLLVLYGIMGAIPLYLVGISIFKDVYLISVGIYLKRRYPLWTPYVLKISKVLTAVLGIYLYSILVLLSTREQALLTHWGTQIILPVGISVLSIIVCIQYMLQTHRLVGSIYDKNSIK
jgi:phosphatidylglycerophosphate synthase